MQLNEKQKALFREAENTLSEAISALAVLENEHQQKRKKAQEAVTLASGRLSALVAIFAGESTK